MSTAGNGNGNDQEFGLWEMEMNRYGKKAIHFQVLLV